MCLAGRSKSGGNTTHTVCRSGFRGYDLDTYLREFAVAISLSL